MTLMSVMGALFVSSLASEVALTRSFEDCER